MPLLCVRIPPSRLLFSPAQVLVKKTKKRSGGPTSVVPSHSTAVSRTVLVVSTAATFDQWAVSAEHTLRSWAGRPAGAEFHACSSERSARKLFEAMQATPGTARVAVLLPGGLNKYFKQFSGIGSAVLVVDEARGGGLGSRLSPPPTVLLLLPVLGHLLRIAPRFGGGAGGVLFLAGLCSAEDLTPALPASLLCVPPNPSCADQHARALAAHGPALR